MTSFVVLIIKTQTTLNTTPHRTILEDQTPPLTNLTMFLINVLFVISFTNLIHAKSILQILHSELSHTYLNSMIEPIKYYDLKTLTLKESHNHQNHFKQRSKISSHFSTLLFLFISLQVNQCFIDPFRYTFSYLTGNIFLVFLAQLSVFGILFVMKMAL